MVWSSALCILLLILVICVWRIFAIRTEIVASAIPKALHVTYDHIHVLVEEEWRNYPELFLLFPGELRFHLWRLSRQGLLQTMYYRPQP